MAAVTGVPLAQATAGAAGRRIFGTGSVVGTVLGTAVEVGPPGHPLGVSWPGVPGATAAEVTECAAQVTPYPVDDPLGPMTFAYDAAGNVVVTLPATRLVRSLALTGLRRKDGADWRDVRSVSDIPGGQRLVVAVAPGASAPFGPPLYAVPALPANKLQPALLTGASLVAGSAAGAAPLLRLPDVPAARLRISLVTGDVPQDFTPQEIQLSSVGVVAAKPAADLAVTAADGATVWSLPGEAPATAGTSTVDLRVAAEAALTAALPAASGAVSGGSPGGPSPVAATFTLSGRAGSRVWLSFAGARGALLREFPGIRSTTVAGAPAPLADVAGLPAERPGTAVADLTVRYDGLRVLADLSDPVPDAQGGVGGYVVGAAAAPALRPFPPAGFGPLPLARVGLVGRAAEDAALSVTVVTFDGDLPGAAVGPPGVVDVAAGSRLDLVWVDLPELDPALVAGRRLALAVAATAGQFLWATGAGGRPLARLVVRDPAPAAAAVRLAGTTVCTVDAAGVHLPAYELPPGAFRDRTPLLDCPLFVTVDLSDLVLRYPR